ncbi:hypothetical protein L6452_18889 [Arctium lappa]|uniref:Uncharacterized protein n=1 Tax=Arctium lappa TaxID=4217 RepID=A0ACB9B8E8_ARCLA|nr:hypothetical protein L6452_18889 [Arctium lappa]
MGKRGEAKARCKLWPRTWPGPAVPDSVVRSWPRHRASLADCGRWTAESQWIVAARPLCHLQYPVAYLSRLQRILPAA